MKFITAEKSIAYASQFTHGDVENGLPRVPAKAHSTLRVIYEERPAYQVYRVAQDAVRALGDFRECLLWVTESEIWPSSENLHLYYRVRQSYGEHSVLAERPGAIALNHEIVDLVSLVQLGMLFGWDMYAVTSPDYGRLFVSHDGWLQLSEATPNVINDLTAIAEASKR